MGLNKQVFSFTNSLANLRFFSLDCDNADIAGTEHFSFVGQKTLNKGRKKEYEQCLIQRESEEQRHSDFSKVNENQVL